MPLPSSRDDERPRSRLFIFLIGCCVMLPWPVLGVILHSELIVVASWMSLIGAFVLLFKNPLSRLEGYLMSEHADLAEPVMYSLVGVLVLMWIAILCLPFFGHWKRYSLFLWLSQSTYAAAQALCGWFFLDRIF